MYHSGKELLILSGGCLFTARDLHIPGVSWRRAKVAQLRFKITYHGSELCIHLYRVIPNQAKCLYSCICNHVPYHVKYSLWPEREVCRMSLFQHWSRTVII